MSAGSGPPRRTKSKKAQRIELLAFVEGLRTEEQYVLDMYRRNRANVLVTVDEFRGGPLQLVERAIAARKLEAHEFRRGRGRPHDQIWCVFDVDEHPNLDQAIRLADQNGIHVAVSNPCLELWFVLHFESQTAYIHRDEAQTRSEHFLNCRKVLIEKALDDLTERYPQAASRAKLLDTKHEGDGSRKGSNPSSNVWELADIIRQAQRTSA